MSSDAGDDYRGEQVFDDAEESGRGRKSLWGLISVLLAIALIIVILMLVRSCGFSDRRGGDAATRTIEPVLGSEPVEGMLSVWVNEDVSVSKVLRDAGVSSSGAVDMGDGHWVVSVPSGAEPGGVEKLKKTAGVVDAGLVFQGGADGSTPGSASP
jgi:hypothetical protein